MDNLIRPSGWWLWSSCPGSIAMRPHDIPKVGDAAHEGTVAHFLAQSIFNHDIRLANEALGHEIVVVGLNGETSAMWSSKYNGVGEVLYRAFVSPWMAECVQKYIDLVISLKPNRAMLFVEQPLGIEWLAGEVGAEGTPDAVAVGDDYLHVFDLKYGREKVAAEGNGQLLVYAYAAMRQYLKGKDVPEIHMHIVQPQIGHFDEWVINSAELKRHAKVLSARAKDSLAIYNNKDETRPPEAHLQPGPHCQKGYCPVRPYCPALREHMKELCDFEELPLAYDELKKRYDSGAIADLYTKIKLIRGWADQIEDFVVSEMEKGESFPGLKLVRGKGGARAWDDAEAVEELLKKKRIKADIAFPRSLISPAKLEAAYKQGMISEKHWKELNDHITKSAGKLTAVTLDDKRPAINPDGSDFETLDTPEVKTQTEEVKTKEAKVKDDLFDFLD